MALAVGAAVVATTALGSRSDGIAHIVLQSADIDSLDPALSYNEASGALVDATCARLLGYSDTSLAKGLRLEPEVAAGFPRASSDRRKYTFTLRAGFRFDDGTPVRATAFANSIKRALAPALESPLAPYMRDIVGADRVRARKTDAAIGVVAHGLTLVIRLTRPVPDFLARTTVLCAVPPTLPADPEGVNAPPAAGPYYVSDCRAGRRTYVLNVLGEEDPIAICQAAAPPIASGGKRSGVSPTKEGGMVGLQIAAGSRSSARGWSG